MSYKPQANVARVARNKLRCCPIPGDRRLARPQSTGPFVPSAIRAVSDGPLGLPRQGPQSYHRRGARFVGGDQPCRHQTAARADSLILLSVRSDGKRGGLRGSPVMTPLMLSEGSGRIPPHPPDHDGDPRPRQTSRNPAFWGRISPVFWGLRCNVVGGWGGSAHYPDPTAQSAPAHASEVVVRRVDRRGRSGPPQPASALQKPPKNAKFLFFLSSC